MLKKYSKTRFKCDSLIENVSLLNKRGAFNR